MTRRALVSTSALLIAALAPASAAAASKAPVVKSITPLKVSVGQKLTLKGNNFLPGKGNTRVFFVRVGGEGVASAAADKATKKKVVVTVPLVLNATLAGKSGRFKVRVLTERFGSWSKARKSPVVTASADGSGGGDGGGTSNPEGDCDRDGLPNGTDADDDNDLLPDAEEKALATDACKSDTDGDTVEDGFEYESAIDLNETVLFGARDPLPYPGKRPYPNPLYPDAGVDYDGDGLSGFDEFSLWLKFGNHEFPLNYSDGLQTTVPTPLPAGDEYLQMDSAAGGPNYHDGWLDDGERDADGDNLTNWDESHGRMTPFWWESHYDGVNDVKELPYPVTYAGTDMLDRDSDGDGVHDGLDDQDHDGLRNQWEVARPYNWNLTFVSQGHSGNPSPNPWARTNPFNPCKPVYSKTCHTHPPHGYYQGEDWVGASPDWASANFGPPGTTPGPIFAP
jgi:hypothetical protein